MKKYIITASVALAAVLVGLYWATMTDCAPKGEGKTIVFIREGETPEKVRTILSDAGIRATGFSLLRTVFGYKVRPGRYAILSGENMLTVFRRLRNGQQEPVNLTIPSVRTMPRFAGFLASHLMMDSAMVAQAFHDSAFCAVYGYTVETLPALFIPNTYQVYWTTSLPDFMQRMKRENRTFWNDARDLKAAAMEMTHEEIATLASIIDEETANNKEKPMIAGMYINRLHLGMPLQADPTVKFALGDFSLRRIWGRHLTVESPYNTYKNVGLPPGPIRIPSVAGIDAVLNHVEHPYLYMCAKEDFSGTHNFARTYSEHLANARRYTQALNERNIK